MRRMLLASSITVLAVGAAACQPADPAVTPDDTATPDDAVTTPDDTATPDETVTPDDAPTTPDDDATTPDDDATTPEAEGTADIVGIDYTYQGVPGSVSAGTELSFSNDSEEEAHELVLVRLPDDEGRSIDELLVLPQEELMGLVTPNLVGVSVAAPGDDGMTVEGELVVDEPGTYAMLCFVPTGADPDEFLAAAQESDGPPQVEGGPPHVVNGMYALLTVE